MSLGSGSIQQEMSSTAAEGSDSDVDYEDCRIAIEVMLLSGSKLPRFYVDADASVGQLLNRIKPLVTQESYERITVGSLVLLGADGDGAVSYSMRDPYTKIMLTGPVKRARQALSPGQAMIFQLVV